MDFFTESVGVLQTVLTLIGAGVGGWGIVNLLEAYGSDNAGGKSQGIKQLMSGGGIILLAQFLIPSLNNLMTNPNGGGSEG